MSSLLDLQHRLGAAIISGNPAAAVPLIRDDAPGAAARLAIYANHFRVTLIDALAATFPVVRRLVGSDFFNAAARSFVRDMPPAGPCLFEYGGAFPAFLDRLPAAASLPWLGDVASLEWAISEAAHAPDADPLSGEALQRLAAGDAAVDVVLHPSCRLVQSPFPVDRIWQAHQASDVDIAPIDLACGGAHLLVHRQNDEVGWLCLEGEAAVAFIAALLNCGVFADALEMATERRDGWDPIPLLAALFSADLLVSTPKFRSSPQ